MFPKLDPLLHSELRLAVMSILAGVDEADFTYLKKQTGATSGNLSVQIDKLTAAGYITVEKGLQREDAPYHLQDNACRAGCIQPICRSAERIPFGQ